MPPGDAHEYNESVHAQSGHLDAKLARSAPLTSGASRGAARDAGLSLGRKANAAENGRRGVRRFCSEGPKTAAPRSSTRSRNALLRFSSASLALGALLVGWCVWSGAAPLSHEDHRPVRAPAVSVETAPVRASGDPPYRVVAYSFSTSTGEAEGTWLLADDSVVSLAEGGGRPLRDLRPGDLLALAPNGSAILRSVSEPFIPRAPPAASENQSGQPTSAGPRAQRVVGTVKHTTTTLVDLRLADETLSTTPNHPFWELRRGEWVRAGDLVVGDLLVSAAGSTLPVDGITIRHGRFTVYNLEVDEAHTYFAGRSRVFVHNGGASIGGNPCAQPPQVSASSGGGARFIADDKGNIVDTHTTPPGSYIQPNGGRTDILQREDHGAGLTHTHDPM